MIGSKNQMSIWLDSYGICEWGGFVDSEKMWGTVVCSLLETQGFVYTRFVTSTIVCLGQTCVVVYEINSKQLVDALGIHGA